MHKSRPEPKLTVPRQRRPIIEILYQSPITMAERSAELLKGTLDLLILRTLNLRAMHGSAIADRIAQVTNGTFQVRAGSLFPALHPRGDTCHDRRVQRHGVFSSPADPRNRHPDGPGRQ